MRNIYLEAACVIIAATMLIVTITFSIEITRLEDRIDSQQSQLSEIKLRIDYLHKRGPVVGREL